MSASLRRNQDSGGKCLSCSNCRQRKIKCDKTDPICLQCASSSLHCIFPARKRYKPNRRGGKSDLSSRLDRIENVFSQLEAATANNGGGADLFVGSNPGEHSTSNQACTNGGRIIEDRCNAPGRNFESATPPSKYLCAEFWSNLCHEVEGIRQALGQQSDCDDSDEDSWARPEYRAQSHSTPGLCSELIFSPPNTAGSDDARHPSKDHISFLCDVYFRNIDPVLKILHRPTTSLELNSFAASANSRPITHATEALFFAMYFGAVTSLSPDECLAHLGEDRAVLVERYKHNTERALNKADYLNSDDLKSLQSLTLYIVCSPLSQSYHLRCPMLG